MQKNRPTFPKKITLFSKCRWLFPAIVSLVLLTLFLFTPPSSTAHIRTLKVVAPWEMKSPDPAKSGYIYLRMELIETLTSVDHEGNQQPCLATDWTTSPDGLEWRFTLRKGVKFHDGSLMTPEAVVNALRISLNKPGMLKKIPH